MSYVYLLKDKNGLFYVGQTEDIKQRLRSHKSMIQNEGSCCSRLLDIDFECEILEEYGNEEDLMRGEQTYYDIYKAKYNNKLVNKIRPLNTRREYRQQHAEQEKTHNKEYYQQHAEQLKENKKEYYKQHAEQHKTHNKEYYEQHKEQAKKYYQQHKEQIKERAKINRQKKKEAKI
jgi:predicted GIY-YIG superfamily endonuclease